MQTADTSFNFLIYNVLLSIGIACFFDSLLERNYKILSLPACIMICSVAALITETILIHQVVMRNIFTYACWYFAQHIFYKGSAKQNVFHILAISCLLILSELPFDFVLLLLKGDIASFYAEHTDVIFLSLLLIYPCMALCSRSIRKKDHLSISIDLYLWIIFLLAFFMIVLFPLFVIIGGYYKYDMRICFVLAMACFIGSVITLWGYVRKKRSELALHNHQEFYTEVNEYYLNDVKKRDEYVRLFRHDLQNQLETVKTLQRRKKDDATRISRR